jgi:hypothetical protein
MFKKQIVAGFRLYFKEFFLSAPSQALGSTQFEENVCKEEAKRRGKREQEDMWTDNLRVYTS